MNSRAASFAVINNNCYIPYWGRPTQRNVDGNKLATPKWSAANYKRRSVPSESRQYIRPQQDHLQCLI